MLAHLSNQGTFLPNKAFHCEPNSSFSFATSYTPVQSNLKIKFQKTETAQLVHSATQNSLYWRTDQNLFKERNLILVFNRVSMFLCVCVYISMQSLYIHHMCVCICLYTVFLWFPEVTWRSLSSCCVFSSSYSRSKQGERKHEVLWSWKHRVFVPF